MPSVGWRGCSDEVTDSGNRVRCAVHCIAVLEVTSYEWVRGPYRAPCYRGSGEGSRAVRRLLPSRFRGIDVGLCQQGVQFFPDRLHALREMRRVLRVGSRLAFTVWSAIGDTPYHAALADALARHLSPDAGSMARASSALHNAMELHGLVASAGFRNVNVRPTIKATTLPLPAEFVPGHLAALPIAQEIARLSAERRNALVQEMTEALNAYVDRGQLVIPAGVHVVTADA